MSGFIEIPSDNHGNLRQDRVGVMLHYDASRSDAGAVEWLGHPDCRVSYNWLVLDDGTVAEIAPADRRGWHAGKCRPRSDGPQYKDANSAFYGVSAAHSGSPGEPITEKQLTAIAKLVARLFGVHGWTLPVDRQRIVSHSSEAWPRGRKTDPEGGDKSRPILTVGMVVKAMGAL